MKLKNLDLVVRDLEFVAGSYDLTPQTNSALRNFFDADSQNQQDLLANPYGITALNTYVEFVSASIFPCDGSWIGFKSKEKGEAANKAGKKVVDYLVDKFAQSNFYNQITKMIKQGALYNKGFIQTTYNSGGLSFETVQPEDIMVSMDSNEASKRAYAVIRKTLGEICMGYEGEIIDDIKEEFKNANISTVNEMCDVTTCIIPVNDYFFDKMDKRYSYKKITLFKYAGQHYEIRAIGETDKSCYYTSFPVMTYLPHYATSLASQALSFAVNLNTYEQLMADLTRKILDPPMAVSHTTANDMVFDLGPNGIVPLSNQERIPQPIESKQRSNITGQEIQRITHYIDKVFKLDLIERVKVTNLSQYEAAANELNALKAIQPAASDLVTRVPVSLLKRVVSLLMQNDSTFKKLMREADGETAMVGMTGKMKTLEKAMNIGRFAQGAVPYLQISQSAAQIVDSEAVVTELARALNVSDAIKSEQEVAQEREAMQQQQMAEQQKEATLAQSQINVNQAKALKDSRE